MDRMIAPAPKTFIGPVMVEKRAGTITSINFHVLQSTSGMIKLEYPSKADATAARKQLLKSRHTYRVPSNALLQAIQEALSEASQQALHTPGEEPPAYP